MEQILNLATEYWFVVLFIFLVAFAYLLGIFTSVEPKESQFPGGSFYYKDIQVSSNGLGELFKEIRKHIKDLESKQTDKGVYVPGGIFYDDPGSLQYQNKMRVVAGVLVRADNSDTENYFKKLGYQVTELPKVLAIHASHPMTLAYLGI